MGVTPTRKKLCEVEDCFTIFSSLPFLAERQPPPDPLPFPGRFFVQFYDGECGCGGG